MEPMPTSFCPPQLESSWRNVLEEEFQKDYMRQLKAFLAEERRKPISVFPHASDVFNAFKHTPFDEVKVIIMGQDPYHGLGQAHGLSFSVPKGIAIPPSLQNIYKELHQDLNVPVAQHGCLIHWAKQGVLLLNATLTVSQAAPMSHHNKGWEVFTDAVIKILSQRKQALVFILWGKSAQQKCQQLLNGENSSHLILKASHPSPYSADYGFFGCRHFSKTNQFLVQNGKEPIDWNVDDRNLTG